jgi:phage gp46-like protein
MSDITTVWNPAQGGADWQLIAGQLQGGADLQSAILISLFTDRLASPDDPLPDNSNDRRGWWADLPAPGPLIGSRLWLLGRAKQQPDTMGRAQDYINEALQWLIDDGVVARFDVHLEWLRPGVLGAQVVAIKPDGDSLRADVGALWKG